MSASIFMKRMALIMLSVWVVPALAAEPSLLLTHLTLIDGTGMSAKPDMTIAIEGEHIAAIYPDGSRAAPKGARVEDLSGRYVIPGLIDAHVHLTGAEPDFAHYLPHLQALLRGGVTAVRDMAGDDRLIGYLADEANSDALASPDIYYVALMAGPTFFAEDVRVQEASAGEQLGFAPWMQAISPSTDIPLAVAEAKGTGATALKLYANLPASLVTKIAAEAHRQGLRVWTHATIFPATPGDAGRCRGGRRRYHFAQSVSCVGSGAECAGRLPGACHGRFHAYPAGCSANPHPVQGDDAARHDTRRHAAPVRGGGAT